MKKKIIRGLLGFLGFLVLLLIGVLASKVEPEQELVWAEGTPIVTELDSVYFSTKYDSLYALFGSKKELPKGYEVQALLALSAYPELKDVKVKFEFSKKVNAPLEANFAIPTLLLPRKYRKYRVIISSAEEGFMSKANFRHINYNGQVGILAHELGHIQYYHNCNLLQIGNWGLGYLTIKNYASTHERETDKLVIHRGLGWQLLESTIFFNQYFGSQRLFDKEEMLKKYMLTNVPMETQNEGYYLSVDGVFQEMMSLKPYKKSFEEQMSDY